MLTFGRPEKVIKMALSFVGDNVDAIGNERTQMVMRKEAWNASGGWGLRGLRGLFFGVGRGDRTELRNVCMLLRNVCIHVTSTSSLSPFSFLIRKIVPIVPMLPGKNRAWS